MSKVVAAAAVMQLFEQGRIAQPGTMFDYSNNSVDTLCRLVEVVTGLDFDTYQRRHIFEPLKMHETWFFPPEDARCSCPSPSSFTPDRQGRCIRRSRDHEARTGRGRQRSMGRVLA